MLKNKFKYFKNSSFFLPGLFMIASIMFLSVIYAILTSTLNIIGSGKVLAKEINDYYYKGGYFYSDENCENKVWSVSKKDYLTKMTDVVSQMSDGNNIYILSEYSVDENEDINISGKNIIIKRHESYRDSSLIKVTSGSSLNISVSADSALVIDGQEIESEVENGSVFYVDTNGTLSVCGEGTKNIIIQNNVSTSAINGGIFYIAQEGNVNFENVSIKENKISSSGNIYGSIICAMGTLTFENSEITKNTISASSDYGSLYVKNTASVTLINDVVISENENTVSEMQSNLCVDENTTVNTKNLDSGKGTSKIGVTTVVSPTSDNAVTFSSNGESSSNLSYFFSDNEKYIVKQYGGNLQIATEEYYYSQGYFYKEEDLKNKVLSSSDKTTPITKLYEAVNQIGFDGNIFLVTQYSPSSDEKIDVPTKKTVNIKRYSTFTVGSMLSIVNHDFTIQTFDSSSQITLDGCGIESTVSGSSDSGGGIFINGGSLTLKGYSGTQNIIVKNHKSKYESCFGVAINLVGQDGNVITLSNTKICDNVGNATSSSTSYGGAIGMMSGDLVATDSVISGNGIYSQSGSSVGGAIYGLSTGTATLTRCTISNNVVSALSSGKDSFASAVGFYYGNLVLNETEISGNQVVSVANTDSSGGAVSWSSSGNMTVKGKVIVKDNIYKYSNTEIPSNIQISKNCQMSTKDLSSGSYIGITSQVNPTLNSPVVFSPSSKATSTIDYFFSDNEDYYVSKSSGGDLQLEYPPNYYYYYGSAGSQTTQGYFYTDSSHTNKVLNSSGNAITKLSDAVNIIHNKKIIYLDSEYNLYSGDESIIVPYGKSLTIKKNFTVNNAMINIKNNCSIKGETGSNLVIDGSDIANTGGGGGFWAGTKGKSLSVENVTIQHCNAKNGAAIYISNTVSATIKNVEIVNNRSEVSGNTYGRGVGICNKGGGTVDVINCNIHGNTILPKNSSTITLNFYGVGVYCSESGAITNLTNCKIYDNTFSKTSGHSTICQSAGVFNESTMTITDCSITNNKSLTGSGSGSLTGYGSGVYQNKNGTLSLSGVVTVNGNTFGTASDNLYLVSGGSINTKGLKSGSKIGIKSETVPTSSSPVTISKSGEAASSASYFTSDESNYTVVLKDGVLNLAVLEEIIVGNTKVFTINSSNPSIKITPDGYYYPSDSSSMTSFTGTYVLTGTFTGTSSSTPSIIFENTYSTTKTIKVKFKDLVLKAYDWCTLGYISGNAPMEIYVTSEGTNSLQAYNHPSFQIGSDAAGGTNVRLSVTSGSILLGSVYSGTSYKVITDKANLYFNGSLFTEKSKNTTFTSSGYTQ